MSGSRERTHAWRRTDDSGNPTRNRALAEWLPHTIARDCFFSRDGVGGERSRSRFPIDRLIYPQWRRHDSDGSGGATYVRSWVEHLPGSLGTNDKPQWRILGIGGSLVQLILGNGSQYDPFVGFLDAGAQLNP